MLGLACKPVFSQDELSDRRVILLDLNWDVGLKARLQDLFYHLTYRQEEIEMSAWKHAFKDNDCLPVWESSLFLVKFSVLGYS